MKLRRFFHRIWAGHYPTYRVSSGILFEPYLFCVTCEDEDRHAHQIRFEKLKAKVEKNNP